MKERLSGIVLGSVKHSDRHNVTGVYTRERGRMAFLTPAATSRRRQGGCRLMPLSVIELQASVAGSRELHIPSSVSTSRIWRSLYYDPVKSGEVMFLTEFLGRLLRDAPAEPRLWDFIVDSIALFDAMGEGRATANFHIAFLISLMPYMGIQPDLDGYAEGMEFDMQAGAMVSPLAGVGGVRTRVDAARSALLPVLARMNYANAGHFRFSGRERSELLEGILKYYGCHFPGCEKIKSLEILKEVHGA